MRFKEPNAERLAAEVAREVHPDTREILEELDAESRRQGWGEPLVTDAVRTPRSMLEYYVPHYQRLARDLAAGKILSGQEKRDALAATGRDLKGLQALALARFSWHLAGTAVDLSLRPYAGKPGALHAVVGFMRAAIGKRAGRIAELNRVDSNPGRRHGFEFLVHTVTAPHIHVARIDPSWRDRYTERLRAQGFAPKG
jgi:hypothetical protein